MSPSIIDRHWFPTFDAQATAPSTAEHDIDDHWVRVAALERENRAIALSTIAKRANLESVDSVSPCSFRTVGSDAGTVPLLLELMRATTTEDGPANCYVGDLEYKHGCRHRMLWSSLISRDRRTMESLLYYTNVPVHAKRPKSMCVRDGDNLWNVSISSCHSDDALVPTDGSMSGSPLKAAAA